MSFQLSKDEYSQMMQNKEGCEKVLEKVIQTTVEVTLRSIPDLIANLLKYTAGMNSLVTEFYKDNPEFTNHKDLVGQVLTELDSKNPGLTMDKILEKAAPVIKERVKSLQDLGTINTKEVTKPSQESLNNLVNGSLL